MKNDSTKKFHELADVFPLMTGDEFKQLVADIKESGQYEPILVDENDKIIDGRNRYRACSEAGIEPKIEKWSGEGSIIDFIVSKNMHRRHLSKGQRAAIAAELLPEYEEEARQRQGTRTDLGANLPESEKGRAREKIAKQWSVSARYVATARMIKEKGEPELFEKLKEGRITLRKAENIVKRQEEQAERHDREAHEIE